MSGNHILHRLYDVILERKNSAGAESYVASLCLGGVPAIAAKLREECAEVLEASASGSDEALVHEAADLIFHLWLLLGLREVPPGRVYEELARRFGTGGFTEKASRSDS